MPAIDGFSPFVGQHCETTTTGNLLNHAGLALTEPMLYGLGEGLAFGVFAMKSMPGPFVAGRTKPETITKTLAGHLGFEVEYRQTRSQKQVWANVADFVDAGRPVGVKLNCRFLDYFTDDVDFAGHYVTVHGYDDESVFVVDTALQGGSLTTRRASFDEGRLWKGPMASNALTWTINVRHRDVDWPRVLTAAIVNNARAYLTPPIKNFGAPGIRKTAALVRVWPSQYAAADLAQVGDLMEHGGTGGGLFRNFYRDFLIEANQHLKAPQLDDAVPLFEKAAGLWTEVARHLMSICTEGDGAADAASMLLRQLADIEERAIATLATLAA